MSNSKLKEKLFNQNTGVSKEKKLIKQLVSDLMDLLEKTENGNGTYTEFINEIKQVLEKDPIYFTHKIYPKLRKKYEKYKLREIENPDEFLEFEEGLLKNICLLKDEENVIYSFRGQMIKKIEDSNKRILFNNANIFFTNKRMIVLSNGLQVDSNDPKIHGRFKDDYIQKYYISMIVNRSLYDTKPCFGYEFPIFNLYNIKKTKTHVEFAFYQGKKKRVCEIFPQDPSKLKEIKDELLDKNYEDIPPDLLKTPCKSCGRNIKGKHRFCKYCGYKNTNYTKIKKEIQYFF